MSQRFLATAARRFLPAELRPLSRGFAQPADKPKDRFAEFIASGNGLYGIMCEHRAREMFRGAGACPASGNCSTCHRFRRHGRHAGEGKGPIDKDEIPDQTGAYGDDPVATISDVRNEEEAHKHKKGRVGLCARTDGAR